MSVKKFQFLFLMIWFSFMTAACHATTLTYIFPQLNVPEGQVSTNCAHGPPPLVNMSGFYTFYKPGNTQAIIDHAKASEYGKKVASTTAFTALLLSEMQIMVQRPKLRRATANCIASSLIDWARAGSFLSGVENNNPAGRRQAILVTAWSAVSISHAYSLSKNVISREDDKILSSWFDQLIYSIISDFHPQENDQSPNDAWLQISNNHRYWAAVAVGLLGIDVNSQSALNWSMQTLQSALEAAPIDGALPHEISRGMRAAQYQNFAMQALAYLVAIADANDVNLTTRQELKLASIAAFAKDSVTKPESLEQRIGTTTTRSPEMLFWIEIILPHFQKTNPKLAVELEKSIQQYRPITEMFVALPATALMNRSWVGKLKPN